MSTNHHGAGGSYVIDEAGRLSLQHRTKSREEAKADEDSKVAASAVPAAIVPQTLVGEVGPELFIAAPEASDPGTPSDQKNSSTRSASE